MRHLVLLVASFLASSILLGVPSSMGATERDTITITPWTSYTVTIGATTTAPAKATTTVIDQAMWRRVGDSLELSYAYGHTSNSGTSAGSGTYYFSIPSGLYIDDTKFSFVGVPSVVGTAAGYWVNGGTTDQMIGSVLYSGTPYLVIHVLGNSAPSASVGSGSWPITGSTVFYKFVATLPLSGMSTRKSVPRTDLSRHWSDLFPSNAPFAM